MRSTIQNLKIKTTNLYLIIHFITVGFSHGFQVSEKLLQEIATLNDEIISLQSTTSARQTTPFDILTESTTETGSDGPINLFMPTTDADGKPLCLQNSPYENFCTEDESFPQSFANQIQSAVKASLTSLQPVNNIYECGSPPHIECNHTTKNISPTTLQVRLNSGSRRSSEPEFAFALQTADFQQTVQTRICDPDPQSCSVGSLLTKSTCRNAGASPSYSRLRNAETAANNVIIINSAGLAEVAEIAPQTQISCWCICEDNVAKSP